MPHPLRFRAMPIVVEAVLPLTVHAIAIVASLLLTYGRPIESLFAIIVSLVWLKVSKSEMGEKYSQLRVNRYLFSVVGGWLGRDDGTKEFDKAQSEYALFDENSIEHEDYKAIVTANGIADIARNAMSLLIQLYLIVVVLSLVVSSRGA